MQLHLTCYSAVWPGWQKILFRFFFIYFALYIMPLPWLGDIPGIALLAEWYGNAMDWAVNGANAHMFHIEEMLVPMGGSGDTSYGWAQVLLFLCIAAIGCTIWSIVGRKKNYARLDYLLCTGIRYFIAFVAFLYGIQKVFTLQMGFPTISQMATPLGDFLPMRFSWMFIGYSKPYQAFSGIMEVMVGLLLLFRRTATFGTMMALAVFTNVMMLNLCYDIPVKIFSMHLVLLTLFLLAHEYRRIAAFFILNKEAAGCNMYAVTFSKKWMRFTRIILKVAFIIIGIGLTTWDTYGYYSQNDGTTAKKLLPPGMYAVNYPLKTTQPTSKQWTNIVFENGNWGSIQAEDSLFAKKRYGRQYFAYSLDSVNQHVDFKQNYNDSLPLFSLQYQNISADILQLVGKIGNDSVCLNILKKMHHFQLQEKQFHWLSEGNR